MKIGDIVKVTVTGLTDFGAFVKLNDYDAKGMIHISEVANLYVKEIKDHLKIDQVIDAKIIAKNERHNSWDLSIKQASDPKKEPESAKKEFKKYKKPENSKNTDDVEIKPVKKVKIDLGFEDKLKSFLKKSEEKQIDIRRNLKAKHGIKKTKKA